MARVAIFGATSAVAAEVACLYAARGDALHLVGRNPDKLAALGRRLAGARLQLTCSDFDALEANAALVARVLAQLGGADVVLIAHGDVGDQLRSERDVREAERIIDVNFTSAVALLVPIVNHLEAARAGRLGVITSVAGERGRPRNYTYGASKAALNTYLQGVRSRLYPAGASVTTIKLGPVDSPMTVTHPKNFLFAQPAGVARDIVASLDARHAERFVPSRWAFIMPLVKHVPELVFQRLKVLSSR